MTSYDELQELHNAVAARDEAEAVLAEARLRLRLAAQAIGMGASELARELGFKSPTSAADLLDAAKNGIRPVRPCREPKAKQSVRRARKEAPVLNLVTGVESETEPQVELALYSTLEDVDLVDFEPRTVTV